MSQPAPSSERTKPADVLLLEAAQEAVAWLDALDWPPEGGGELWDVLREVTRSLRAAIEKALDQ